MGGHPREAGKSIQGVQGRELGRRPEAGSSSRKGHMICLRLQELPVELLSFPQTLDFAC